MYKKIKIFIKKGYRIMRNKIKDIITTTLALALLTTAVSAAVPSGTTTLQDDGTAQGDMEILGTVEPITMIDVTIPVDGLQFVIKADRTIEWTNATITNNGAAPLNVSMISAGEATLDDEETAAGYNATGCPELVADDKFSDWNNLGKADTKGNIAISVNEQNISGVETTPVELGSLKSAFGVNADTGAYESNPQTLDLTGSALYGKAWDNTADLLFKYDTVLEFAMPD